MNFDLSLYLVTDRSMLGDRNLCEVVSDAVAGGCTMVQLREKNLPTQEFIREAKIIKRLLADKNVPLIINDRVDVALAVDADGVHIGQGDMPYEDARRLLGRDKIIGLSVENMEQVRQANLVDVDYIGISPVFATPTKTDTARPFGLEGCRTAVQTSRHPAVAIGGINHRTARSVWDTGVAGMAIVSDIMASSDPRQAAETLRNTIDNKVSIQQVSPLLANKKHYPRVLTIAGSDSGGGAGIQADIKTISALGCYAASAITAVTVQNTMGVQDVEPVTVPTITAQIRAVLDDIGADSVKIGMLHSAEVVSAVAKTLRNYSIANIVLDPVMVSTSGHRLIEEDAIGALLSELVPLATVITPNIPEAEILLGQPITCQADLPKAARALGNKCKTSVLLKAGHLKEDRLTDVLFDYPENLLYEMPSTRIHTQNTHGTGCTLSSAVAAYLALGNTLADAVKSGTLYINDAIVAGKDYEIGHGFGPVHHFCRYEDRFSIVR